MSVSSTKTGLGLRRFFRDKRGGVAVIFALAFTPVAFLSLVMIDFSRASTARSNLQETLDAATLLTARSTAITASAIQTTGDGAFTSQVATNLGIKVTTDTFVTGANNTIVGDSTASVQTLVAGLFLGGSIPISAHSEVVRTMNKLEIAMVLDTTGSMTGSKISNLQTSATDFVNTMSVASAQAAAASIPNAVKIAIVPFSTTVKVSARRSARPTTIPSALRHDRPADLAGRPRARHAVELRHLQHRQRQPLKARIDRFALLKAMGGARPGAAAWKTARSPMTCRTIR